MNIATVAIDLAKNVFELAAVDDAGQIVERRRLSRRQLERYFENRVVGRVVMEDCGTAHYWARRFMAQGIEVRLLPPHYVRAYVRRNKTDRTDAAALLEAVRAPDILPVQVKSLDQQAMQGLHRIRTAWRTTRTARVNTLRGLCREFGICAPLGLERGLAVLAQQVADEQSGLPPLIRPMLRELLAEIRSCTERLHALELQLGEVATKSDVCQRLQTIPGVGPIAATALVGAIGDIHSFPTARRFASWLGLTPRECSSGDRRHLGSISKRGDVYLRMLLVHGARAVLFSGHAAVRGGRPLDALRGSGVRLAERRGHNRAAVALANKLARIVWATWYRQQDFERREPVAMAA